MLYTTRTLLPVILLRTTVLLFKFTLLSTCSFKYNLYTKTKISVCAVCYCTLQEGKIFLAIMKPEISLPYPKESCLEASYI